jgi:hypothetical protein
MGIFGIAKKGFGMLGKARAKKKMLSGTSTRAERIQHGGRSPDIKSVPISKTVKKGNVQESIRKGKQHFYIKNIDEVNKHQAAIHKGEKAQKKLKHMTETKRAYHIGKSIHPSDPAKGNK